MNTELSVREIGAVIRYPPFLISSCSLEPKSALGLADVKAKAHCTWPTSDGCAACSNPAADTIVLPTTLGGRGVHNRSEDRIPSGARPCGLLCDGPDSFRDLWDRGSWPRLVCS